MTFLAYHLDAPAGLCAVESYDPRYEEFVAQVDGSVLFDDDTGAKSFAIIPIQ